MENKKELLKYMIFAGVMGIVVGGIDTVFGKGLILIGEIRNKYFWFLNLLEFLKRYLKNHHN